MTTFHLNLRDVHNLRRARGELLGCPGQEVNGSMVIGSMGYFTDPYEWGIPWGYNPMILTIAPNFQRDIQVIH